MTIVSHSGSLGKRIALMVFAFGLTFGGLVGCAVLVWDYQHQMGMVRGNLDRIEQVFLNPLRESVWTAATDQTQSIMDGLAELPGVETVEIRMPEAVMAS